MELRKGDTVKVLSGVDKGKTGEILNVIASENKVLVKGVNVRKKSVKVIINCALCVIPCIILLLAYVGYVKGLFVFYTYPPLFGKH